MIPGIPLDEPLAEYRRLAHELFVLRWSMGGRESDEEEELLEQLDEVWWRLSDEQRSTINAEPPKTLIKTDDEPAEPPRLEERPRHEVDSGLWAVGSTGTRRLEEALPAWNPVPAPISPNGLLADAVEGCGLNVRRRPCGPVTPSPLRRNPGRDFP